MDMSQQQLMNPSVVEILNSGPLLAAFRGSEASVRS